jgi:solute carrier family 25 protein 39/40
MYSKEIPNAMVYFYCYETGRDSMGRSQASYFIAGCASRLVSTAMTLPAEVWRTRVQAVGSPELVAARELLFGPRPVFALWSGLLPTLARDVPFSGLYWWLYENFKREAADIETALEGSRVSPHLVTAFGASSLAAAVASFVTMPMDVLKTRSQLPLAESAWPLSKRILREEGASTFFAGSLPRTLRVAPACSIMLTSYEAAKFACRDGGLRDMLPAAEVDDA